MSLGALAFLSPWLLTALLALPALWWLLRTVPPRPRAIAFPPTRMLKDLEDKRQTPARTPWWLMLIRLLAAALVILALAEPVLNPRRAGPLAGSGPLVLVVDNTWAVAPAWAKRIEALGALIGEAEAQGRGILIAPTATTPRAGAVRLEAPKAARETAAALRPEPFASRRADALAALEAGLAGTTAGRVVWIADGLDHADAAGFADALARLAGGAGGLTVLGDGEEPLGLAARLGPGGTLLAEVKRAEGGARAGQVEAWSARGQRLGETGFALASAETRKEIALEMPLELRNQVARLTIAGHPSAGAVHLLDSRSRWQRVGLIASTSREQAQPLLAPLYYVQKALAPFMEMVQPKDGDVPAMLEHVLAQNATIVVMADVGKLVGASNEALAQWVAKGGVLVRFAGTRLEQGGDDLLPAPLRAGGRTLGGALSWATPQGLAAFEADSLFAGLVPPAEVTISRQVLADPARIGPDVKVWARLKDGTPLVTAARRGEGTVVLFHVTANSDWSSLPLSGLFVEMLRRIATLTGATTGPVADAGGAGAASTAAASEQADVLTPLETLNGFGELRPPPATAQAIRTADLATTQPSATHPPGLYGPAAAARALNLIETRTVLKALPPLPSGAFRAGFEAEKARPLKPGLLAAGVGLLLLDILAVLLLQMGFGARRETAPASMPAAAAALVLALGLGIAVTAATTSAAHAQSGQPPGARSAPPAAGGTGRPPSATPLRPQDALGLKAALKTQLAYVITGDEATDRTSRQGLAGLTQVLTQRTAIEPGEPIGVDAVRDELAFFPILYWPVLVTDRELPPATLAKVDAYMKQGGLIIFDTRDQGHALPGAASAQGPGAAALQRLLGTLDIPRLEPVPDGHVLTKSFYLLKAFPGRWDGGQTWVEAQTAADKADPRRARRSDGVSSIVITANDLASAWAVDGRGRPLFPVVPGGEMQREMAYRTGVNIVMYALTGNYKADQVHVPALLERLGQ